MKKLIKNNLSGVIFWLLISIVSSLTLFFYFMKANSNLIVLSFTPILSFLAHIVGSLKKGKIKLFPSNWVEYIIENVIFFSIFMVTLFIIEKEYSNIKIIAFLIMTAAGIYNTISILKHRPNC